MITHTTTEPTVVNLNNAIAYASGGVLSKTLIKTAHGQTSLFCLAAGTEISEHTSTRHATLQVLEGQGTLTLEGTPIELSAGIFVVMSANAPHALSATENLAFLLTLTDESP